MASIPLLLILALTFALPHTVSAQVLDRLEFGGGYTHITGNFGTDGMNLAAAWRFTPKVSIAADYDTAWDNSRIGTFELTTVGAVTSKSHLQDVLFGPRVFFSTAHFRKYKFIPFGEAQFGVSHLASKIEAVVVPSVSTSDTAFSWMLGAGGDYKFSSRWSGRIKIDLLRTHFADVGQSRLRLAIGIAYTFGAKE